MAMVEQLYSISEIADRWRVSKSLVRNTFRGRDGVLRFSDKRRASMRIPEHLVLEVMAERGYIMPEVAVGQNGSAND